MQDLIRWVSENKQVGEVLSFLKDGEICWSTVAIQKWEGVFKVYVGEVLESQMVAENYQREEALEFEFVEDAIEFVSNNTKATVGNMKPCKGQKIFNPKL